MHFTGTIWRPPYESESLLLEASAGCTHHKCKFCTLYDGLPFKFRMSPLEDIERDLQEAQLWNTDPFASMAARLQGLSKPRGFQRVFLTGANPFVLKTSRLLAIAGLIGKYIPSVRTIGCFARVTDVSLKSDGELLSLAEAGYNGLTIGIETGDDKALGFMNKGYSSADILEQCGRLDKAGVSYSFFYLAGISGAGRCEQGAKSTAAVCNRLRPKLIGANMLTVFPGSELHKEILLGRWREAGETEKYIELRALIESLTIPTEFAALGASNPFTLRGSLPEDKEPLIREIDTIIKTAGEEKLRDYRKSLPHL